MSLKPAERSGEFTEILGIIQAGRSKAFEAVNVALIETYWAIGEQLSRKVTEAGWGKGIVKELADWLGNQAPDSKGYSASNLWRMKQFYETYVELPKLATLLRELSWSKHLLLLSYCKSEEEKEFYLLSATRGRWSHRELERQIKKSAFERTMLSDIKLATMSRVLPENAAGVFKDSYLLDFLDLPETHSDADLQAGLLLNLRKFLMELRDGFAFVGEKVRVQGLGTRILNSICSSIIETYSASSPLN
jgi:predicted nuclease of restriction endonuclease-like (RecB) superfamily